VDRLLSYCNYWYLSESEKLQRLQSLQKQKDEDGCQGNHGVGLRFRGGTFYFPSQGQWCADTSNSICVCARLGGQSQTAVGAKCEVKWIKQHNVLIKAHYTLTTDVEGGRSQDDPRWRDVAQVRWRQRWWLIQDVFSARQCLPTQLSGEYLYLRFIQCR